MSKFNFIFIDKKMDLFYNYNGDFMKLIRISAIWCTSCILTNKDFKEIKEEYPNFEYEELDYDTDNLEKYNVGNTLPVIIVYKDNNEVTRIIGEKRKKEIEKVIEEVK